MTPEIKPQHGSASVDASSSPTLSAEPAENGLGEPPTPGGPAGSQEAAKASRAKEDAIREAEDMTNDSALPGLVSEDIGGAGAALNGML